MFLPERFSNTEAVTVHLLNGLGIHIRPSDVSEELTKHPDYPSMLSISDVLNWFNVDNIACSIDAEELTEVPTPFIAHTNRNNDFVTVNQVTDTNVRLSDNKRNNYNLTLPEFKKIFNGVVLQAEATSNPESVLQRFLYQLSSYKWLLSCLALVLCFVGIIVLYTDFIYYLTWQIALLAFFKTAGLTTAVLLLVQSIDKNNPLVQTLCGGGRKTNCNAILTSKAAMVFKGLTWSEVGFFYFAGTWLVLLFNSGSTSLLQLLALLNMVSLPYTVYSINYQARIAKQWCVFCTAVQVLLWLEFIPLITTLQEPLTISVPAIISLLIFMALPAALWVIVKPKLLEKQQLKGLKRQLHKFKYNRELFEASLKAQPRYATPSNDWSIILGNVEANTIITMVSNPYCQPCSATHTVLDRCLERLGDIQLRIVFTAHNHVNDRKTIIVRHLMALNAQGDPEITKDALNDWYGQENKNYEEWSKSYPVKLDESEFQILDKQVAWCDLAEITATPTLLINGYRLPAEYRVQDIKYMLA